jgi:hypothetical protein
MVAFPAIALALLLVTACGQTVRTTAPARSGLQLTWRAGTVPAGALTVAPGDGDIGYACHVESARRIAVSVTHDRAANWTHAGDIALAADANQCFMTVDGLQPTTVVVAVIWEPEGASPITAFFTDYVTFDGGATWRKLSAPHPYLAFQFATYGGVIYGYLRVSNGEQDIPELATSSDQMRTWHPILQGIADFGGFVDSAAFWLNPANGALLVADMNVSWSSVDAGAHWTKITVPGLGAPGENVVVQAPVADQPWHLCAANNNDQDLKNLKPNTLTCSSDGGQTWQSAPALNITFTNGKKGTFATPTGVFALASDGAILALASGSAGPWTQSDYRLAANSQQWQSLNLAPGSFANLRYYPAPGGGVLWTGTKQNLLTASYP